MPSTRTTRTTKRAVSEAFASDDQNTASVKRPRPSEAPEMEVEVDHVLEPDFFPFAEENESPIGLESLDEEVSPFYTRVIPKPFINALDEWAGKPATVSKLASRTKATRKEQFRGNILTIINALVKLACDTRIQWFSNSNPDEFKLFTLGFGTLFARADPNWLVDSVMSGIPDFLGCQTSNYPSSRYMSTASSTVPRSKRTGEHMSVRLRANLVLYSVVPSRKDPTFNRDNWYFADPSRPSSSNVKCKNCVMYEQKYGKERPAEFETKRPSLTPKTKPTHEKPETCEFDGCNEPARDWTGKHMKWYCTRHRARANDGDDMNAVYKTIARPTKPKPAKCTSTIKGAPCPHKAEHWSNKQGDWLCKLHEGRSTRGHPMDAADRGPKTKVMAPPGPKPTTCQWDGCTRPIQGPFNGKTRKYLCKTHEGRAQKGYDMDAPMGPPRVLPPRGKKKKSEE
ncbi:hypothetical protein COCMIDRAFT_2257 [Bipolaris oryzae ATCC 44560]|uniref:Uncharacterized protein n=1 Tax=Bipolaris oryzae ATCC 44560 TaxID=930090 RepID=W6ZNC3_COCMI|nr:uncharacterized protein COCMIDRAFT_2257 [Bipolaris oryzae ATCC 44560]EUC49004.1 hypothetical protein COCMIDRAFT_2257 [Bipolaris oryzae ATCC 44560]